MPFGHLILLASIAAFVAVVIYINIHGRRNEARRLAASAGDAGKASDEPSRR